jgi:hypothetical protein
LIKRQAWRKFGKVALVVGGVLVACAAGLGLYIWWDDTSHSRAAAAVASSVRKGAFSTYWDVKLGMPASEVEYLKGKPNGSGSNEVSWEYETPDAAAAPGSMFSGYIVWMDANKKVEAIQCYPSVVHSCEALAGVDNYSTERDIVKALGAPQFGPHIADGVKTLVYGSKATAVIVVLEQDRLKLLQVASGLPKWAAGEVK